MCTGVICPICIRQMYLSVLFVLNMYTNPFNMVFFCFNRRKWCVLKQHTYIICMTFLFQAWNIHFFSCQTLLNDSSTVIVLLRLTIPQCLIRTLNNSELILYESLIFPNLSDGETVEYYNLCLPVLKASSNPTI